MRTSHPAEKRVVVLDWHFRSVKKGSDGIAKAPTSGHGLVSGALWALTRLVYLLTLIPPLARCSFPKQATMPGASALSSPPPSSASPTPHFRAAALRRLRVPLPFNERWGTIVRRARAGVLGPGPRSVPLERTAGARVAENVLLRDLNLDATLCPFSWTETSFTTFSQYLRAFETQSWLEVLNALQTLPWHFQL